MSFIIWALFFIVLFYSLVSRFLADQKHERSQTVAFVGNSWFDFFTRRSLSQANLIKKGYDEYSKHGQPFRMAVPTGEAHVLPPTTFVEAGRVPSSVLDAVSAHEEVLNLAPVLGEEYTDVLSFVSRDLTRAIPQMIPRMIQTVREGLGQCMLTGASEPADVMEKPYSRISMATTTLDAVASIVSKLFVGEQYGNDQTWTSKIVEFAHSIIIFDLLIRKFPRAIRPYVRRWLPTKRRAQRLQSMVQDDISHFVDQVRDEKAIDSASVRPQSFGPQSLGNTSSSPLLLHMLVKYVLSKSTYVNTDRSDPALLKAVTGRLLIILIAAIDTTSMTFTQLVFDLISDPRHIYIDPIIQQIHQVRDAESNGDAGWTWTPSALSQLTLLDSFIKESQRLHPMLLVLSGRNVLATSGHSFGRSASPSPPISEKSALPSGVNTGDTDSSFHVPRGARTEIPLWGVHTDPQNYVNPLEFDGFRFARDDAPAATSTTRLSSTYLVYGNGRHACPGRHFAATLVKLMAVEFLLAYDWGVVEERPKDVGFGVNLLPDLRATVGIRAKDT